MKIVKAIIDADILSRTAEDAIAANPTGWVPDDDPAHVPLHLTTCLKDLIAGPSTPDGEWPLYVTRRYGDAKTMTKGIDIVYASEESAEVSRPDGDHDDTPGAEYALVKVLCRVESVDDDDAVDEDTEDRVEAADLRCRYLLDNILRSYYSVPGGIAEAELIDPTGIDKTLKAKTVRFVWLKEMKPDNATEKCSLYRLEYTRLFGK